MLYEQFPVRLGSARHTSRSRSSDLGQVRDRHSSIARRSFIIEIRQTWEAVGTNWVMLRTACA
jgi:hypothetical protein